MNYMKTAKQQFVTAANGLEALRHYEGDPQSFKIIFMGMQPFCQLCRSFYLSHPSQLRKPKSISSSILLSRNFRTKGLTSCKTSTQLQEALLTLYIIRAFLPLPLANITPRYLHARNGWPDLNPADAIL
jgi:hypothetical protein